MKELTHFSLFTGIGGIDLAAEWAGFQTVGQCEFADYPTKVLEKHWPDVPRWRDIRDVNLDSVRSRGIRTVDLISGGFPCQPFSVAGKQRGKEDDRYLWPEMLRVVEELRPTWVLGENVAGLVRMALDQVLADLESKGYTAIPFIIPACGVEAQHRRERVFIIAYSSERRLQSREKKGIMGKGGAEAQGKRSAQTSNAEGYSSVAYSNSERLQGGADSGEEFGERAEPINQQFIRCNKGGDAWAAEPNVGRVANGVPNRVDRLKCLGNAVVPQQVYPILKAIAEIERGG